MGAHDFKHNMVSLFAWKPVNINASMAVCYPASRYYCDVNWSYLNVCAKFHQD